MACELFEFSQEELLGVQLSDLLTAKSKAPSPMSESHLGADGEIIEVSGKVVSRKRRPNVSIYAENSSSAINIYSIHATNILQCIIYYG